VGGPDFVSMEVMCQELVRNPCENAELGFSPPAVMHFSNLLAYFLGSFKSQRQVALVAQL
jgi:hypothetical protein